MAKKRVFYTIFGSDRLLFCEILCFSLPHQCCKACKNMFSEKLNKLLNGFIIEATFGIFVINLNQS